MIRKVLLGCGIASSLLYAGMNIAGAVLYSGYDTFSQEVSELSAIGAPSRSWWVPVGVVYEILVIAFGVGVWLSANRNRWLHIVGGLLVVYGLFNTYWPPMHQRDVIAAGGATLTDTLHLVWAGITVLLMFVYIAFGAAALGKRFRWYSITTIVLLLAFGLLTVPAVSGISTGQPTPWAGVVERINIFMDLQWVAVLSIVLLRTPKAAPQSSREEFGMNRRVLVALTLAAAYWFPLRRWMGQWGSTPEERARIMPGDAVIPHPTHVETQAVTVDAPPPDIWPWLVQIGSRRGGLYSYDWLDRLCGFLEQPSASSILPEFQRLAVGDRLEWGREYLTVAALEPNHALVLSYNGHGMDWVWQFGLYPLDAQHTRLVSRGTERTPNTPTFWLFMRVMEPASFVMTSKMLLNLKNRAERLYASEAGRSVAAKAA